MPYKDIQKKRDYSNEYAVIYRVRISGQQRERRYKAKLIKAQMDLEKQTDPIYSFNRKLKSIFKNNEWNIK